MAKIEPVRDSSKEELRRVYSERYRQTFFTSFNGIHSTIIHNMKDHLKGKSVLDIGCGAGRLALMCAKFANRVDAFDFEAKAIDIARKIAKSVVAEMGNMENVQFYIGDIDEVEPRDQYSIITFSEVIEHVQDPISTLKRIHGLLVEEGQLVISCPNFVNFRGDMYMTMLKLFDLPMSLADLRQIAPYQMEQWAESTGYRVSEVIGTLYDLGWLDRARQDVIRRIPLAWRDKGLGDIEVDKLNEYLRSRVYYNQRLLDWLIEKNCLKRYERVRIPLERKVEMDDGLWDMIVEYMNDGYGSEENVYYSDTYPFNMMGAGIIYILIKERQRKR